MILNMEVVEHVADLAAVPAALRRLLKPGGLMIVATLNRTLKAWRWRRSAPNTSCAGCPRGTHDWNKFVKPDELARAVEQDGAHGYRPARRDLNLLAVNCSSSTDTDVNYMMVAERPE